MALFEFLVAVTSVVIICVYLYFKKQYGYWKNRDVKYIKPTFPFGNVSAVMLGKKTLPVVYAEFYKQLEGEKYGGFYQFHKPILLIRDPDLIKSVIVKDFEHFHSHGFQLDEELDPVSSNLFLLEGKRWKEVRSKVSPTFTSGKMKMMFQTMAEVGQQLQEYMNVLAEDKDQEIINVKDYVSRFGMDVVASCAFGMKCDSLKNPDNEFRKWALRIFNPGVKQTLKNMLFIVAPSLKKQFRISNTDDEMANFFRKIVTDIVEYRERNNIQQKDFMQLLIQLKNFGSVDPESDHVENVTGKKDVSLTLDQMTSQAFSFLIGGYESTSSTVSFCLYELAMNYDIQTQVQDEIDTILEKHGDKITYEAIHEMAYLNKVLSETLRKYPPGFLSRECNEDYTIPGSNTVIEKGVQIMVSTLGMHYDPKYYPDPEKFDPERFNEEEKSKRHHYVYLPFGEGPRICIGMRFAVMQSLVALVSLLSKYEFHVCEKTTIPVKFDPKLFTLTPLGGCIWLRVQQREKTSGS